MSDTMTLPEVVIACGTGDTVEVEREMRDCSPPFDILVRECPTGWANATLTGATRQARFLLGYGHKPLRLIVETPRECLTLHGELTSFTDWGGDQVCLSLRYKESEAQWRRK